MKDWIERLRKSQRFREVAGVCALAFALACLLSVLSYTSTDSSWFFSRSGEIGAIGSDAVPTPTGNWIGIFGANLSEVLLQLFGVASFLVALYVGAIGWIWLRDLPHSRWHAAGHGVLVLCLCALLDLLFGGIGWGGERFDHAGGWLGYRAGSGLEALLARPGAILIAVAGVASMIVLTTGVSLVSLTESTWTALGGLVRRIPLAIRGWTEQFQDARAARRDRDSRPAAAAASPERASAPDPVKRPSIALDRPASTDRAKDEATPEAPKPVTPASAKAAGAPPIRQRPIPVPASKPTRQPTLPMERGERGYSLPPLDLLNEAEVQSRESEQDLLVRAEQITEKFREFNIEGQVVAVHPGPVVTTFEFKPDAGVKYSKITGMTDDLSLALKAVSVRIDRMVGRSTVGIEVPNRHQETIFPRELIGSQRFRECRSKLTLALGKDIHGEVYTAELDRMPHLLIAGATGAGKSVGLNGMIVSLLYKATPRDLRFIMIDTKMIELGIYSDIPHLLIPVVTDPKLASAALKWAVREMELRYRRLASVGLRNIAQFNELLDKEPDRTMDDPKGGDPIPLAHMPYIVIVIDEMADLMMISSADVEESVMRLAQMARAVGIHLILATQRPSVDVITGTIKANFPSRIAFRVSQRVDSRTIIDQQGAEHLLGRGDMLLLPTGSSRLLRMHSGFITETEINRITTFLKKMAEPVYDESVLSDDDSSRGDVDPGERDEMYYDAVRTVVNEGKCSITLLQRRLQLGYARAARIVDMMEQEGVVSPGEGSKPREILISSDALEELEAGRS